MRSAAWLYREVFLQPTGAIQTPIQDYATAQLPGLSPVDQALTRDLLARIDAALSPYFE